MRIRKEAEWTGYGLALLSVALGSLGPPVFKKFIEGVGMNVGISYMLILGGISTMLFYLFPKFQIGERRLLLTRSVISLRLFCLGIFTAFTYLCYAKAMNAGLVVETVLLSRLSALFSVFLSVKFLKEERVRNYSLIGGAVIFCSGGVVMSQSIELGHSFQEINASLVFYGMLVAIFLAGSSVLQRYIENKDGLDEISITSVSMIVGGAFMAIYTLVTGGKFIFPNAEQLILLLFLGFGTIAIPTVLSIDAYRSVGVSRVAFVGYFMPIFSGAIAYFLNNERNFSGVNLSVGFILITLGVICTKCGIVKIGKKF